MAKGRIRHHLDKEIIEWLEEKRKKHGKGWLERFLFEAMEGDPEAKQLKSRRLQKRIDNLKTVKGVKEKQEDADIKKALVMYDKAKGLFEKDREAAITKLATAHLIGQQEITLTMIRRDFGKDVADEVRRRNKYKGRHP